MKKSFFLLFTLFFCSIFAEEEKEQLEPLSTVSTVHSIQIGNQKLNYVATAGTIVLYDENNEPSAKVFFTAYTKEGENVKERPVTFCFNGGPGSSSVWLHLGCLGPKKILTDDEGKKTAFPYQLVDNKDTLLEITDLVFIDPVGTGFSKIESENEAEKEANYYSLEGDIVECSDFIRDYLTYFKRWLSPKYLIGESYGTTRAAGLSEYLQRNCGINLYGVVLISLAVDFQNLFLNSFQKVAHYATMPYITHFPSYATTAYYHKKIALDKSFEEVIEEARNFAEGEYALALLKGDRLSIEEFEKTANKMAKYSGLPVELIKRYQLRVPADVFLNELLKSDNLNMGGYDARVVGFSRGLDSHHYLDPSSYNIDGAFTACINSYLREELAYDEGNSPYVIINEVVNQKWDFSLFLGTYSNISFCLENALIINPNFKIFTANGYYDLVTPFSSSLYTTDHLNIPPSFKKRITVKNYEGGHMMYLNPKVLEELKADLKRFYK